MTKYSSYLYKLRQSNIFETAGSFNSLIRLYQVQIILAIIRTRKMMMNSLKNDNYDINNSKG